MSDNINHILPQKFGQLSRWASRVGLTEKLAVALAVAAAASGVATYGVFAHPPGAGPRSTDLVVGLLYLDFGLLLALGILVGRRMVQVWLEHRRGAAGSGLHVRLVTLFGLVALTPAVVVAIFSALVFNFGIQNWFNDQVRTAVTQSLAVAESYLKEHRRNIGGDVLAFANDLNRQWPELSTDKRALNRVIELQVQLRSLSEAVIFDDVGRILGRSSVSFSLAFERTPIIAIEQARKGRVVYLAGDDDDRIRAMVALSPSSDAFLMVGRFVDAKVLDRIEKTKTAANAYNSLEQVRQDLEFLFALIFVVVALLLLFVSAWVGLSFANKLARPISGLITAADRIRAGDLSARVDEIGEDELASLARAFNRMTDQLGNQREELVEANRQIDARRRFIEAVFSGVSAGVIGLDGKGCINFPNQTASDLMDTDLEHAVGQPMITLLPEMAEIIERARKLPGQKYEAEIEIHHQGRPRTLLVRIIAERSDSESSGFVVTFDNITELISAQRKAAWSDVARRLAHEIKNPLTPIQLAAERLRRRYSDEIKSDPKTFDECIDTIIRQVGDIGEMIGEFSLFARMPAPALENHDLLPIIQRVLFLQRGANPEITYHEDISQPRFEILCDDRQLGQALINLFQNAADSVTTRLLDAQKTDGDIWLSLKEDGDRIIITVADNGLGLPRDIGRALTDPYVTTRAEGTGLGLAIVQKIMEDHGGALVLEDRPGGGAKVSLIFATKEPNDGSVEKEVPGISND
ncbi:MAG: PAS domain-containing sensor histidine kinase [Rhodospirillales bacterium]|nr:PAS domain-containing sensor histidine kinase [Rhodospirillales bacterium]